MQWRWLAILSWPEFKQHPWRTCIAVMAIALGVALAHAVHLINTSALAEFSQALRTAQAQADWVVQSREEAFDEQVLNQLASAPDVAVLSPVLDANAQLRGADGRIHTLRVLGVDALSMAEVAPELLPRRPLPSREGARAERQASQAGSSDENGDRSQDVQGWQDWFALDAIYLNPAAQQLLGQQSNLAMAPLRLSHQKPVAGTHPGQQTHWHPIRVAGEVTAPGAPLVVMDVAAAQQALGRVGELSRIDLKLHRAYANAADVKRALALPEPLWLSRPEDASIRTAQMSQAYRVNLSVLALVALFTGGFLVYSVLALSVSQRAPQLALLGVLGWSPAERQALIWRESLVLGVFGSALGLGLGAAMAWAVMQLLGGDLGGGHFSSHTPRLAFSAPAMLAHGVLGVVAALLGGALPARAAALLPPAQTLKGAGQVDRAPLPGWVGGIFFLLALLLAFLPPWRGIPLAAYLAVAALLLGGMAWLPLWVSGLASLLAARRPGHPLALLAIERAHRQRSLAAVAVSGVVSALALATALTIMVHSFRHSMLDWLDDMLPAALYVRMASDTPTALPAGLATALQRQPGIAQVREQRVERWPIDPQQPALWVMWRPLHSSGSHSEPNLPFTSYRQPPKDSQPVYISEAVRDRHSLQLGQAWPALGGFLGQANERWIISGIYRDYARSAGSVTLDWQTLPPTRRMATELAIWLSPDAHAATAQRQIEAWMAQLPQVQALPAPPEVHNSAALREHAMTLFDRSFAVTQWLQMVAIGIGLFGVSASFSAQALSRRKEFGLLAHLGLTSRQIQHLVALEGLAWCALGALAGVLLGMGVSLILVKVVNPQSFHWSMDMHVPARSLLCLTIGVVAAGTLTAWLTARGMATGEAIQAVKEDW